MLSLFQAEICSVKILFQVLESAFLTIYALISTRLLAEQGGCCVDHDPLAVFSQTPGHSDPNCGAAFRAAEQGFLLGIVKGCSQANPSNIPPEPPSSRPVCK